MDHKLYKLANLSFPTVFKSSHSQFVKGALYCSSSYGFGPTNWGWKALCGPPRVFPTYGDQSSAWAGRHRSCPSEKIVVVYDVPVIPSEIHVYETNLPGSLVSVKACPTIWSESLIPIPSDQVNVAAGFSADEYEWTTLWSIPSPEPPMTTSRINVIRPVSCNQQYNMYMFDMICEGNSTWYEIDAIKLVGFRSKTPPQIPTSLPLGSLAFTLFNLWQKELFPYDAFIQCRKSEMHQKYLFSDEKSEEKEKEYGYSIEKIGNSTWYEIDAIKLVGFRSKTPPQIPTSLPLGSLAFTLFNLWQKELFPYDAFIQCRKSEMHQKYLFSDEKSEEKEKEYGYSIEKIGVHSAIIGARVPELLEKDVIWPCYHTMRDLIKLLYTDSVFGMTKGQCAAVCLLIGSFESLSDNEPCKRISKLCTDVFVDSLDFPLCVALLEHCGSVPSIVDICTDVIVSLEKYKETKPHQWSILTSRISKEGLISLFQKLADLKRL
ncbi:hypothetical protein ADUPG1_009248 [Aduncisulcus paluster]|uniref:BTB/POZ domain-containing protein n=1 Tax=Aduncisulcus paluster TaxID=2918883 RepID=A0ABQ5KUW8_9EUKA|nr:hypothetical protein ADUPG1_009248 [Aduncisulcus paluster]